MADIQELLRLAPTILLIAGYVWFTRRQMGGLGGQGPGGRGLFNVGKAQVGLQEHTVCVQHCDDTCVVSGNRAWRSTHAQE